MKIKINLTPYYNNDIAISYLNRLLDHIGASYSLERTDQQIIVTIRSNTIEIDSRETFQLYFIDGSHDVVYGETIHTAFNTKYSNGALRTMDFYDKSDTRNYNWNGSNWEKMSSETKLYEGF